MKAKEIIAMIDGLITHQTIIQKNTHAGDVYLIGYFSFHHNRVLIFNTDTGMSHDECLEVFNHIILIINQQTEKTEALRHLFVEGGLKALKENK